MSKILTYTPSNPFPSPQGVLVGGCFDILHYGHLSFLKSARSQGYPLVVALESNESILHSKKKPPIHTQQQRSEILAELACVDHVVLIPLLTSYEAYFDLVQWIHPKIIAITEGDPQQGNKERQAQAIGAEVKIVNHLIEGLSSRLIRQKVDQDTLTKII